MSLYDEVSSNFEALEHKDGTKISLKNRVVVNIQNVAQYLNDSARESGGRRELTPDDVPAPVCPWDRAWFEFSLGMEPHNASYGRTRVGFVVDSTREETEIAFRSYRFILGRGLPLTVTGRLDWGCSHTGKLSRSSAPAISGAYARHWEALGVTLKEVEDDYFLHQYVLWLALSFANCKNVRILDHATPPKVAAKRLKAGKPVGVTYKTLVIDPMKETLRSEGGIEKNGLKKALHICRGHFATYTADKPLFGHFTGTVWKPMHVRGDKKRGEVKKDYRVLGRS